MSFAGFRCTECKQDFDRPGALAHFTQDIPAHPALVPAAVIEAIWRHENHPRRGDDHISPSMAGGCMREYAIARAYNMYIDPRAVWKMLEGTFWHEVMQRYAAPGWIGEVRFPDHWMEGAGVVALVTGGDNVEPFEVEGRRLRRYNGVWEYELWPGLWLSWQIDALRADLGAFDDYKTKDSPVGAYKDGVVRYNLQRWPVRDSDALQLNIYAHGIGQIMRVPPPTPRIWQLYKGIQDETLAWQAQSVPVMDPGDLERAVRGNYEMFLHTMRGVRELGVPDPIGLLPLQGLAMVNSRTGVSWKCVPKCCGSFHICKSLPGWEASDEL
jgi:hypothetical protein